MNIVAAVQRPSSAPSVLTAAFDSLSDGILVFDADDKLVFWNRRLDELIPGFDEELAPGLPMDDLSARLDAYDDGNLTRQCRRGAEGVLVMTVRPLNQGARRERQARIAEQRWRDMAESTADWAWESDSRHELVWLSENLRRSPSCDESLVQDACLRRLTGGGLGEWLRLLPALRDRTPFRDFRIKLSHDQETCHFGVSGKPIYNQDGIFLGFRGVATNISELVERQEESDRERGRLLDGIEYLNHGLALFDQDDCLILCNERYRKSFGAQAHRVVPGTPFIDLLQVIAMGAPAGHPGLEEWIADRLECHQLGLTHERRYPDGRWFLVKDMRLKDGCTVVTRTDITDLKRREQAVRDSEARFRAVFQHAAIGIAVVHPGGRIAQSNHAFERMLGYSSMDMIDKRYAELVHPDDLPAESRRARQLLNGEISSYRLETRYLRKNGQVFWGRLTVSLVRGDGVERFAIAMIEDIEERKQAEADLSVFRTVVEASAEAVAILSPDGRPMYINSAHEKLFGRSLGDAAAVSYRDHYAEDSRHILQQEVIPALRRGDSWEGVLNARDSNGRIFPLWQRAGMVRGTGRRPQFFFAFMHDNTAQQQVQNELYKAKEVAEQANIAKTRFLAAASHDLRQPLQALSMFVAVLANRDHSPENQTLINRIEDSVVAVEALLNGLLDVSKLEAGLVVPMVSGFNVAPLLDRLAAEFEPQAQAEGLDLRVVHSQAVIRSDSALLERILRNLLNNAVRYTPKGRILLGCRRHGDKLRLEVWDTGIGIPASQLKLIFREFHQLANSGRDRRQGLGLGLAIVERLAALLDHKIEVHSEPRHGSVFSVEVPLAQALDGNAPPKQLTLGISRRDASIVVIDDEPDVLESTRLLLESWGHTVVTALDCDEALRRVPSLGKAPDLILADYRLQNGATGGQAIGRIRQRLKTPIPAIILTGDTAPERLRQAKASGHGLLHKPVQPVALRQMIDDLLARVPMPVRG